MAGVCLTTMSSHRTSPSPEAVQPQILRILRPLVRLLIRSGVPFPVFAELARKVYVSVAVNDFALGDKEQTDSRISLLTGVHRKEVKRLRALGEPDLSIPPVLSLASQTLARWMGAAEYTSVEGQPLPLNRAGPEPSFETLVAGISTDVRPRVLLDDWLERGYVVVNDQDQVELVTEATIPKPGESHQLYYFGRNLHDHLAAATENILGPSAPFLERAVHYNGLDEAGARHLQAVSSKLALQSLQAANREAQKTIGKRSGAPAGWRWNFGLYVYVEREDAGPEERE
jgi:hypothetical protein